MSKRPIAVIGLVVAVVVLAGIVAFAVAQPAQPGAGQGFPGAGAGAGAGRFQGMMRGMRGIGMGTPAIAVSGDAVFVVSANMIYKFDAETLELLAQAEIPRPQWPGAAGGAAQ